MRKSRYSDEEIAFALQEVEGGAPLADIIERLGVSEATFYTWKKRIGDNGTPELHELHRLRNENAYLRRLVSHLRISRQLPQDVLEKRQPYRSRDAAFSLNPIGTTDKLTLKV